MTESNIDEDEDLIRQDSVLYVYLSKFGYTDFESIPIKKVTPRKIDNISFLSIATNVVKNIYRKLHFMYSAAIQEEELSQKQLTTLLGAKCILNDHAIAISNSINANYHRTWRYFIQELLFLCGIASPVYFLSQTDRITLSNFTMVYGVCLVCYTKYFRFCAYNNLKRFVSTQNQAFDLCRRAIKILGHDFRMKSNSVRNCQRFNDLTSGRLDYLQSLVESLIECMELFVFVNYKMSMLITKILPENHTLTTLTRFDEQSFNLCGEVTYKKLMNFYHIYVLTQSEMLLSLGLAYDIKTWKGLFRSHQFATEISLQAVSNCKISTST
ncbi:hypothetical protein KM043_017679 [Ampulex compressa]|nr:hypothetical protein KM043_017679 [Ampulex compressa]